MTPTRALAPLAAAALFLAAACDGAPSSAAPTRADAEAAAAATNPAVRAAREDLGINQPTVYRFRSVEDAAFPPDPAVCAAAPFAANVRLGASLWSEAVSAAEGQVVNDAVRQVGTATACIRITNPAFPEGLRQDMYVRFDLAEGPVTALGGCTVTSNAVPTAGLVLAGCHLKVVDAPSWYAGGAVTSLSIFNPARLAGFATGSEWTVQLYDAQ